MHTNTTLTPAAAVRIVPSVSQNCFADEIAIDFPSAGRVVERMRDAFLGEAVACATCSRPNCRCRRAQAFYGLDVTLIGAHPRRVPDLRWARRVVGRALRALPGTGESLFHHSVHVAVPAGVTDGATFRFRVTSPHTGSVRVEVRIAIQPSLV